MRILSREQVEKYLEDAAEVKRLYRQTDMSVPQLAKMFRYSPTKIYHMIEDKYPQSVQRYLGEKEVVMFEIEINKLPFGYKSRKTSLGRIEISNVMTGTKENGNYKCLYENLETGQRKEFEITRHRRKLGYLPLLARAFNILCNLLVFRKDQPNSKPNTFGYD